MFKALAFDCWVGRLPICSVVAILGRMFSSVYMDTWGSCKSHRSCNSSKTVCRQQAGI